MNNIHLIEVEDSHFESMLNGEQSVGIYRIPPGGVEEPVVLEIVRRMTRALHDAGCRASWLMVENGEIVGLCSYRRPPENGRVEIGYGVAPTRRERGIATRAVAAMLCVIETDLSIHTIEAETTINNPASGAVLRKNGFLQTGERIDQEDGPVIQWAAKVRRHTNA